MLLLCLIEVVSIHYADLHVGPLQLKPDDSLVNSNAKQQQLLQLQLQQRRRRRRLKKSVGQAGQC